MHQCQTLYKIAANHKIYGTTEGICRITGQHSAGILFSDWVRDTFTDISSLKPGTIISNEALFCFDEASEMLQKKTNRPNPQRFRTYSHIICNNTWYAVTKADKRLIFDLITRQQAEIVSLTDSGQKHLFFKHRLGFWQLDDIHIVPDIAQMMLIHSLCMELVSLGFSQTEIISGKYNSYNIIKSGIQKFTEIESRIKPYRNTPIFTFTTWLLWTLK